LRHLEAQCSCLIDIFPGFVIFALLGMPHPYASPAK
jgi:hypothetical protein